MNIYEHMPENYRQPAVIKPQDIPRASILPPDHSFTGFKPLSREERNEALRKKEQENFSWTGYQVIHKELFSHKYDPTLTVKESCISFNNACISRLDSVVYVQILINPALQKLVIRPCKQDTRDAIRWCIEKNDKRKSRQITCKPFAAKLYDLMGWEKIYRYKMQGTKIDYKGEYIYVFDLSATEMWLPTTTIIGEDGKKKRKSQPPVLSANLQRSFGIPVDEHERSMQIDLENDFMVVGTSEQGSEVIQSE